MKPKSRPKSYVPLGKLTEAKISAKELPSEDILKMTALSHDHHLTSAKPSVQIVKCISFQKFRYSGENRPGKKNQEKEFMTLQLNNLGDKVIRVIIICTDADNRELIHPNGLVGKDCHDGIYDKEYAVTKSCFHIKIPYLRTERIKINAKKDEHKNITQANNIQFVLSQRASHLPSPYKERCLSQCTDKYTRARKFDTTKVCLGVIITDQCQPGENNGSLHAISHMVRNASEKTSLEIHKLSHNSVPAWEGGEVDIFTNEDGPAIEPEKCLVYVTLCDVPGAEEWKSDVFSPSRSDILYKKVITYKIPPIAPNHDISVPVTAFLHLECPQSNQYCYAEFKYTPLDSSAGFVCIDNLSPGGTKRMYGDLEIIEDIKPSVKKLRQEIGMKPEIEIVDAPSDAIKANLKSKLRARQENSQSEDDSQSEDQMSASGDRGQYMREHLHYHSPQQTKGLPRYEEEQQHVYIRTEDPHTGEASYLLDMDASKASGHSNHPIITSADGSPFQPHSQDMKVVAAGYSDAVPPNTTVLIYTTNNGVTEQMTISEADPDQVLLENSSVAAVPQVEYRGKENRQEHVVPEKSAAPMSKSIEQVVRREAIGTKQAPSILEATSKTVAEAPATPPQFSYAQAQAYKSPSVNTFGGSKQLSPSPVKMVSAIPEIRRMVIPRKSMPETSPWEVGGPGDADDYSLCAEALSFESRRGPPEPIAMKRVDASAAASHVAEKDLPGQDESQQSPKRTVKFVDENENTAKEGPPSAAQHQLAAATDKDGVHTSRAHAINSYLETAVVNNLPTFEVSEIAETLVNGLESVDAHVEEAS